MRFIYLLLILSPLPFASARPIWQHMWVVFIGFSGLIYTLRWKTLNRIKLDRSFYVPVFATAFLVFWGVLQVVFGWSATPKNTISVSLFFFSHLIWFLLVFKSFKRRADVPKFILLIGLIVTAYCIYGLIVYFTGNETVLFYKKWASHTSLTSTFVNRNSFAAYAGIGFQCMLAYALWTYFQTNTVTLSFKGKLIHFLSKDLTKTVLITLSLIMLLTALLLTASRAGIVTSLIGATLLILFSNIGRTTNNTENEGPKRRYLMLASLSALALLAFSLSGELFSNRVENSNMNDMRFSAYPVIIDTLDEAPIKGIGIGTFTEVFAQYRTPDIRAFLHKGHSDILEIIMTAGLISGTIFILFLLFITIRLFQKAFRDTEFKIFFILGGSISVQIGLHSLVDFSLQMPAVSYLYISLLAASALLISRNTSQSNSSL